MKVSGLVKSIRQPDPEVVRAMQVKAPIYSGMGTIGSREIKEDTIIKLPLDQIIRSPYQVRTMGGEEDIKDLAESIKENGQSAPIIVRPVCDAQGIPEGFDKENGIVVIVDGKVCTRFELIAGEHRVKACKLLGRVFIDAIVRPVDDRQAAISVATDNAHNHPLCDYDRYLQAKLLKNLGYVRFDVEIIPIIGVSNKSTMSQLWSYDALPDSGHDILKANHGILSVNAMYRIKDVCASHPDLVTTALALLAEKKLSQSSLPDFLEREIAMSKEGQGGEIKKPAPQKIFVKKAGFPDVRIECNTKQAKISCPNIDAEKLAKLIEENLEELLSGSAETA